jgi:hypothetical protein
MNCVPEFEPDHVHLVGSIRLGSVEKIFRTVGNRLGRRLKRSGWRGRRAPAMDQLAVSAAASQSFSRSRSERRHSPNVALPDPFLGGGRKP